MTVLTVSLAEVRYFIPVLQKEEEGLHNEAMSPSSCSRGLFSSFLLKLLKEARNPVPNKPPPLNTRDEENGTLGGFRPVSPGVEKRQNCQKPLRNPHGPGE